MAKRRRGEEQTNLQTTSVAAVFNHRVLRKLHNALSANPEIDLLSVFPGQYSTRLSTMQKQETTGSLTISGANLNTATSAADESADSRCFDGIPTVVFPLSDTVKDLLEINTHNAQCSQLMAVKLHKTIKTSSMIWQSQVSHKHAVFRCNANVVVKVVPDVKDYTEYTSMQYLLEHAPGIPVPRPLGLVVLNATSYIFMSFIPGLTLDKVWPTLPQDRKISIRDQLNDLLLSLKELRRPDGMPLGGTSGEGCKDTRRQTRICQEPITTTAEFEDFLFSNPHFGGPVYIAFLRRFLSSPKAAVVFSHGDIRPENIVVQPDDAYLISGILDWEKSGFYPDYFESIKAASNMSTSESDDWYLYLPACADPASFNDGIRYPRRDLDLSTPPLASITDVKHLSSYNWIEAPTPTIAVPGSPPLWSAPRAPRQLKKDSGLIYIAQNAARHPDSPLEPLFRALYIANPSFDIRSTDVVTDRN